MRIPARRSGAGSSPDSLSAGPLGSIGPPMTASAQAATTYRSSQARPMTLSMGKTKHFITHAATSADAVAPSTRSILRTTFATPSKPISSCLDPNAGRATHCVTWTSRLGAAAIGARVMRWGCCSSDASACLGAECGAASPRSGCHSDFTHVCASAAICAICVANFARRRRVFGLGLLVSYRPLG